MNLNIKRLLDPIKKKIFLLIGRALLTAINNSYGTQLIQVKGLNGETITDIERFQEYGFESYPEAGAESVIGFINGNRDLGITLCVHDRRYRPTDLSEGEVAMYHKDDNTGQRVHLKSGGIIDILAPATINITSLDTINGDGITINLTATDILNLAGATNVKIGDPAGTLEKLLTKIAMNTYNSHKHTVGASTSSTPIQQMVEDTDTTTLTVAN